MEEQKDLVVILQQIQQKALESLQQIKDADSLEHWKSTFLGRSSEVMRVFKEIPSMPTEVRPALGQTANVVKTELEKQFETARERIQQAALANNLLAQKLDVTLPGRPPERGRLHIATQTLQEIYRILAEMGFQVYRSREVESDEYNFELLNIPAHHPARDLWDTFYTKKEGVILRTHTSPGQIHAMREYAPDPVRIILPGMVYRYEQMDASHEIQFNQIEMLAVGRNITFGNLRGTLEEFIKRMFGSGVETRLRPSYFPFTEPSAEMDMKCIACNGKGCGVCSGTGWLEILGCGMVHPVVLKNGGYNPQEFSGFAAGLGTERISMLRHGMDNIRNFWANDIRFLRQF
ncbi:MAG TPA: phenylalanine--tRNA ligase subunit alpha [Anaerolineaceae bacterium]|nr:phenylalanine--tRNA ligase subunit alpha [Anaerolineaceae bacterium]